MDSSKFIKSERLFYIEFLALFTGKLSRKDLIKHFEVSEAAITKDIALYTKIAPDVIKYDVKKKVYLYYSDKNLYYNHDIEPALFALSGNRAISFNNKSEKHVSSWVNSNIKRAQPLKLVSLITRCINFNLQITVKYSSKSSGTTEKQLTPLAIFNDGSRWYIRCFDHAKGFRNYSLEGFHSVLSGTESSITIESDDMWNKKVVVKLGAHPNADNPESILSDYSTTKEGLVEIELRACIVGFFLRRWQVDCSPNSGGDPKFQQLVLINQDELIKNGLSNYDVGKGTS